MMIKKTWLKNSPNTSSIDENYKHSYWRIILILLALASYVLLVIFNRINIEELSKLSGFQNEHCEWFYVIWYLIYIWQAVWLLYGLTTILRKSSDDYFYKYPPIMHWLIYTNLTISNLLCICCTYVINSRIYMLSTVYYILIYISLNIALVLSLLQLHDYQRELYYTEKYADVWLLRILIQNGLALYSTWSFIMVLLNFNLILIYEFNFNFKLTIIIIFIILNIKLIFLTFIENFIFYKYFKFIFISWILYLIFIAVFLFNFNHHIIDENQKMQIPGDPTPPSTSKVVSSWLIPSYFYEFTFLTGLVTFVIVTLLLVFKLIVFINKEIFYKKIDNFYI